VGVYFLTQTHTINYMTPVKKKKTDDAPDAQKAQSLDSLLEDLQSKYGEGAIMKLGSARRMDVEVIPTGSFSLDIALGVGGLPKGRIVEVYGPESSGKTTLALNVVAQAQKKGGKAAFIDAEHALDPVYAGNLGVNVKELLISQPDNGEEALNILESLVRSEIIDVVVVDSVAALTPKTEIEGEMGAQYIGLQARLMSQALRKLTALSAKTGTLIIFINQIRMKIGVMFGCLNYKSKVTLADGSQEWIGKIVNQKLQKEVLSYDWRKDRIVPAKITGWYNNGRTDEFLQVTVYNPSGNGRAQLSCTPNHPILTPVGWRRAEDLKVGDNVFINSFQRLSDFQMQVIRGGLLGDGNLSPSHYSGSRIGIRFRLGHSLKQKPYLLWKTSLFKNIRHTIYEDKKSIKFDLTPLPELYALRQSMYREGFKFFSPDFLARLTPLSLAIWYQDDGNLSVRNNAGTKGRVTINLQAIHPESRETFRNILEERYNVVTTLSVVAGQARLSFDQHNSEKFLSLVKRYVHPSMDDKLLPRFRGKFSVEPHFSEPVRKPLSVPVIKIAPKPKTRGMNRFDIRVRGHHNFLADNVIVHNSPETTPGGRALKFYSSVRIDIRRIAQIKKGDESIGNRVKAKVAKNKVAPPFKLAEFDIMFGTGISYTGDVVNAALKHGVMTKSGASYSFEGEKLGVGIENVKASLEENKKLLKEIENKTRAVLV
jgi:recombination protein RecA